MERDDGLFPVPHPSGLGPMKMSKSVRFSLFALRGYLFVMGLMLGYHLLDLGGAFVHHTR